MKNTKWTIDQAHSEVGFKVHHLMIANVTGKFMNFNASIYTNDKDFTSIEIDLSIDAASVNTGNDKRDIHLISTDFLDVEHFKQITFKSSTMGKPDSKGNQDLLGDLTIRGVTKNVKMVAQFGGISIDQNGFEKVGYQISGKVNRFDFGLVWNTPLEAGIQLVSDEVRIFCEMELQSIEDKDLIIV